METKNIERMWKTGRDRISEQPVPDQAVLRKKGRKYMKMNQLVLYFYLAIYLGMLAASLVLGIINLGGYRGNLPWQITHAAILVFSTAFMIYGIYLVLYLKKMNRTTDDLVTSIRKQIRFYKGHYEAWLWMMPLACVMLILSLNTFIDNDNGHYRINNVFMFFGVLAGMVIFIYGISKAALYPLQHQLKVYLSDLENQSTEASNRYETGKRKWRWLAITGMVLLMALLSWLLILGIIKSGG